MENAHVGQTCFFPRCELHSGLTFPLRRSYSFPVDLNLQKTLSHVTTHALTLVPRMAVVAVVGVLPLICAAILSQNAINHFSKWRKHHQLLTLPRLLGDFEKKMDSSTENKIKRKQKNLLRFCFSERAARQTKVGGEG